MNRHPAHQIADTVMYAAEELRGYMNADDPFPWELTEDDHSGLLPRLRKAVGDIAGCIDGIAKATPDQRVKEKLTGSVQDLEAGCGGIEEAQGAMEGAGPGAEPEPGTMAQPAALAASSFPQPLTGQALSEAAAAPAPPPASATAVPRPGTASPGRTC